MGSVIVGGARTPIGKLLGAYADLSATDLGGFAIAGALRRAGVDAEQVDSVVMGQVLQAGCGQIPARQAAVKAGIGLSVLSRHALAANPADDGLAVLPAQHFPVRSSWSILFPNGRRLSPIAAEFLRHLTEAAKGWVPHV